MSPSSTTTSCSRPTSAPDLYHARREGPADHRLPLPPLARADRGRPPLPLDHRDLARGRPLQVAGHARQRRPRALLHRRRLRLGEVRGLGARRCRETLRNPLYHWTHMELRRPFGIDELADAGDAPARSSTAATSALQQDGFTTLGLLEQFRWRSSAPPTIRPTPSTHHARARAARRTPTRGSTRPGGPTRRCAVEDPAAWNAWVDALEAAAGIAIASFEPVPRGARDAARGLPRRTAAAPPTTASSDRTRSPAPTPRSRAPSTGCARGRALEAGEAARASSRRCSTAWRCSTTRAAGCSSSTWAPCATTTRACGALLGRRHGLRLDRRLRAGAARSRASSTASTRPTSSRRPSSTT